MKLRLSAVFVLFLMFALASCRTDRLTGPNPPATVSDTIARWTFDDGSSGLKDVTGNGHDGIVSSNIAYTSDRFGNPGSALLLDGKTVITTADQSDTHFTGNNSFTICAWVKTINVSNAGIVCKGPSDGSVPGYQLDLQIPNYGNGLLWSWGNITTATLGTNWTTRGINPPNINVADGKWHMLTLVVTAHTGAVVYTDSVLEGTLNDPGFEPELNNSAPLRLGSDPTGANIFTGSLDEVTILSRALDPLEVTARFHEGGWFEHYDTVVTSPVTDSIWTPVNTSTSNSLVVGQFLNSSTGFVGGAYGVFLATNDSGSTWSARTSPTIFTGSQTGFIYGLSFFDANHGVAAGDQNDISITSDGGNNWTLVDASNLPQTDLIRSLCFTNRNTGFVGTSDAYANPSGSICRSNDGGQTWSAPIISTGGGIYNIDFNTLSNNQNGVATGNYGVVYWTNDGGTTWNPGTSDLSTGIIIRTTFMTATTAFAVGYVDDTHGYILRSDDGGHSWRTIKTVPYGLSGIASNGNFLQTDASPRRITAVGNGGAIIESTDGGTSWSTSFQGSGRLYDIRYSSYTRAVIFGVNGMIAVRNQ